MNLTTENQFAFQIWWRSLKKTQTTEHLTVFRWQKCISINQWDGRVGIEMCISTRVCSRVSSASTQNSLTGPARSEFLQTFPLKQRTGQNIVSLDSSLSNTEKSLRFIDYKLLVRLSDRWAVWVTSHLFNDDMFAMIVQPDRHFRGETKLPENSRGGEPICESFSQRV